jgi:signal peptidase II
VRYGFWIVAAVVVALDQWTKFLVQANLPLGAYPRPLIPGFLYLSHVHNTGVAFGQFSGAGVVLILAAAAAVVAIVLYRSRLLREHGALHPLLWIGLALPLGGAIGNMIDRMRIGRVVDFLDLRWFPVFNVADSGITVGAVLLMIYFLFVNREAPERTLSPEPEAAQ